MPKLRNPRVGITVLPPSLHWRLGSQKGLHIFAALWQNLPEKDMPLLRGELAYGTNRAGMIYLAVFFIFNHE
ncbi:MAG: hypothetical protein RMK19_07920 [Bacteroidia bacterium]|nr:hypothetical protein [Bacteroidia bacterium]MDW8015922.1 hypothetical protein [Bacteroidia bacterium]